jgi:hypothetical protein
MAAEVHGGEAPPKRESSTAKAQHTHQLKHAEPVSKLIMQSLTIYDRGGLMSSP